MISLLSAAQRGVSKSRQKDNKKKNSAPNANPTVARSTTRKPPRPKPHRQQPVIRAWQMPVIIRTELCTGSGVKVLDEHPDTELRHVRYYPGGRRELMPRAYTSGVIFGRIASARAAKERSRV